jgi:hypothetical protein
MNAEMEQSFQELFDVIVAQQRLIAQIASNLSKIESIGGGGGGTASIEDYQSGKLYKRNMLLVDPLTESEYRVIAQEYTSVTINADKEAGMIKLVGYDSQIVTFNHNPSQNEINALPDDVIVAVYSSNDTPYNPET